MLIRSRHLSSRSLFLGLLCLAAFVAADAPAQTIAYLTPPAPTQVAAAETQSPRTAANLRDRAQRVTIHRDTFGVPHVYGQSDADCVFGFMYARAEDEFHRIERGIIGMTGRGAEVFGQAGAVTDIMVRAFEIPQRARDEFERAPKDMQTIYEAAADGLNYFLQTHPEVTPALIKEFEPWHFVAAAYSMHLAVPSLLEPQAITAAGLVGLVQPREPAQDPDIPQAGSNMWAIAPSRAATGHAMLFINPHIPIHELYEAHLHSDSGWNVSGGAAYGLSLIHI